MSSFFFIEYDGKKTANLCSFLVCNIYRNGAISEIYRKNVNFLFAEGSMDFFANGKLRNCAWILEISLFHHRLHTRELWKISEIGLISEAYAEPCQTSKMELFTEIVNGFEPLTIFAKSSILHVW